MRRLRLGVNVDHVATLRQARGTTYPDPVEAALEAERAGAESITVHLREDRRHIQDHDVARLRERVTTKLNLEMAATAPMVAIAERTRPDDACLVPERREELTTEGGLDVVGGRAEVAEVVGRLVDAGIRVSLFVDPEPAQILASAAVGAAVVEIHTGSYCEATEAAARDHELARIHAAVRAALDAGLVVHGGHGLHVDNVGPIAAIEAIEELNIGHALIADAVFLGIEGAVRRMRGVLDASRLPSAGRVR